MGAEAVLTNLVSPAVVAESLELEVLEPPPSDFELTSEQRTVVDLKLQGDTYRQIGRKLGIHFVKVGERMRSALPLLDQGTVARLHLKRGSRPRLRRRREMAQLFFSELGKSPLPIGAIKRVADKLGVSKKVVWRQLIAAGINTTGEIQRKHLEFALRVEATLNEPFEEARRKLEVSHATLTRWRRGVRDGKHLEGVLELVDTAEGRRWWGSASSEMDLGIRGTTFRRDLALFDRQISVVRRIAVKNHPDLHVNNRYSERAQHSFAQARELLERLITARVHYVANERRFRRDHSLPPPVFP